MRKDKIISKIIDTGFVAIVRTGGAEEALRYCEECAEGGAQTLEVTFTVPGAHRVLEKLAGRGFILGAGTVLDPETARIAMLSGAEFIVCPAVNPETIRLANRYRLPVIPGAQSITEIVLALELGCDIVKLFPADDPRQVKAIKGPLPQADIMPTGGVTLENVAGFFKSGASAVGVGSSLSGKDGVVRTTREFVKRIKEAREALL